MKHTQHVDLMQSRHHWPLYIKMARLAWHAMQPAFARCWGRRLNGLRIILLRLFGAQIASPCLIVGGARILIPWNLQIGSACAIGADVDIYNFALVVIGNNSVISQRTTLCTGSHDYTHPHMPLIWKPISIGSSVWICSEAFVHPGVTIGDGAVIGARAVVTKDMPEWTVCAGHPCAPLKPRVILQESSP